MTLFVFSAVAFLSVWLGYPLVMLAIGTARGSPGRASSPACHTEAAPLVSVVVVAYNEADHILEKVENLLECDYASDGGGVEVIVLSDGSTDGTAEIVENECDPDEVYVERIPGRRGKTYCQNHGVELANGEVIVFTDANALFDRDAISRLVAAFGLNVGCVCGRLTYTVKEVGEKGEADYWRYEEIIKRSESRLGRLLGANGAIYAVRRREYVPLSSALISDLIEPLAQLCRGRKVVYEPEAVAREGYSTGFRGSMRRRYRITARSTYSLFRGSPGEWCGELDRSKVVLAVQLLFRKVGRWLTGFWFLGCLVGAALWSGTSTLGQLLFVAQLAGYIGAGLAIVFERDALHGGSFRTAVYFLGTAFVMIPGVMHGLAGPPIITWSTDR